MFKKGEATRGEPSPTPALAVPMVRVLAAERREGDKGAREEMARLFAKKYKQIVGIWHLGTTSDGPWVALNLKVRLFDAYRMRYMAHWASTLSQPVDLGLTLLEQATQPPPNTSLSPEYETARTTTLRRQQRE